MDTGYYDEQYGADKICTVGARTFYFKNGSWLDAEHTDVSPLIKVKMLSDAYFDLVRRFPEFGRYLALGNNVIIKFGEGSIAIANEGKDILTEQDIASIATSQHI